MTFTQALQLIERKKNLIGSKTDKGLLIDLILVVPTDTNLRDQFIDNLMITRSPQKSIVPFIGSDVEVWATNSEYLYKQNLLAYAVVKD